MYTLNFARKLVSPSVIAAIAIAASAVEAKAQATVNQVNVNAPLVEVSLVEVPEIQVPGGSTGGSADLEYLGEIPAVEVSSIEVPEVKIPEVSVNVFSDTDSGGSGGTVAIPEPTTTAGLLVFGAIGVGALWQRKKVLGKLVRCFQTHSLLILYPSSTPG